MLQNKACVLLFLLVSGLFSSRFLHGFSSSSGPSPGEERLNLLLITLDTLRADRVSCYSREHVETPNIDSLARRGTLFWRAFAHTSTTLPSHANILLGTTPLDHGVHENANFVVRDEFLTLAELLKNQGFSTGAFVGAFPLDSRFGLDQGFDVYDDDFDPEHSWQVAREERPAESVIEKALDWLKSQKSPWFCWVHCFDPHDPYEPPEPFKTRFKRRPYDGEVAYVDFAMGKLFQYLDEKGLFEKTMVILTGDHGESLFEHGEETHGFFAYNSAIWVPFLISVPGLKPRKVSQNVSHVDIFPTVCDVLHAQKPDGLHGVSLLPCLEGKKLDSRIIYFESLSPYYSWGWAPVRGFVYQYQKYIDSPLPEFYDLNKDFGETENLAPEKSMKPFKRRLDEIVQAYSRNEKDFAAKKIDKDSLDRLRSLGYIASLPSPKKEKFGPEDDVKVLLPYHNKSKEALRLSEEGKADRAVKILKGLIAEKKNVCSPYTNLANIYKNQGQTQDALDILEQGMSFLPSNYDIFSTYVNHLFDVQRFDAVIKAVEEQNLPQMEFDPLLWNFLGAATKEQGRIDEAVQAYTKASAIDPKFPVPYNNLGTLYVSVFEKTNNPKDFQKAVENYKTAIEIDPYYATAYHGLGTAYLNTRHFKDAILYLEKALELKPDNENTLYQLGTAYKLVGDTEKADFYFKKLKKQPLKH